jgi:hypothetical protein
MAAIVEMDANSVIEFGGEINERGYLNSFGRRGFTPEKCILELVANSLDSLDRRNRVPSETTNTNKIIFDNNGNSILIIDNGYGMDMQGAKNMFSMHKENHINDKSRGVSGIGAKPSLSILSEKSTVKIYSRQPEGPYICVTIPWDIIHEQGIYTGKIQFRPMTETEIQEFKDERLLHGMLYNCDFCGTTIRFNYLDTLAEVLEENFTPIQQSSMTDLMNRIGIVFGRDNVEFLYQHHEASGYKKIDMYNYFNAPKPAFYKGYDEYVIENWYNPQTKKDRFICKIGDDNYEVKQMEKRCATKAEPVINGFLGFQHIGDYVAFIGLRNEKEVFDTTVANPKMVNAIDNIGQYNRAHVGTDSKDNLLFLNGTKFVRNNQFIGLIPTERGMETRRGGADSHYELILLQCEVRYNPISSQNSHLDHIGQIQENKNQFDGKSVPLHFRRLIEHLRKEKWNQIKAYFDSFAPAPPSPSPSPSPSTQHESPPPPPPYSDDEEASDELVNPIAGNDEPLSTTPIYIAGDDQPISIPSPQTSIAIMNDRSQIIIMEGNETIELFPYAGQAHITETMLKAQLLQRGDERFKFWVSKFAELSRV